MTNQRISQVETVQREPGQGRRTLTFKLTQVVWILFGILETLIALRVLLKLIAANPGSPIVELIYKVTALFLMPFAGMTATPAAGGMVLEISSLFAMLIYALIAWTIERLIWLVLYRSPGSSSVSVTKTSEHLPR